MEWVYETPAVKSEATETPQARREAPGPPAESEYQEWKSNFYTDFKKTADKTSSIFKNKVDWSGCSRSGKSVPKNTKIAQFSNHVNHQIVILFFHFKGFYHLP
ncbi:hypothetical protein M1D47_13225 [Bacillus sp. R1-10]